MKIWTPYPSSFAIGDCFVRAYGSSPSFPLAMKVFKIAHQEGYTATALWATCIYRQALAKKLHQPQSNNFVIDNTWLTREGFDYYNYHYVFLRNIKLDNLSLRDYDTRELYRDFSTEFEFKL